ncbi:MAG: phosphoribosylamine--glycine ligase [Spirochaetota bacterium]
MKVLVLGSGGREHALVHALSISPLVDSLFWTPGNAGTRDISENPQIPLDDFVSLRSFVKSQKIDLTVVGPEAPLVDGIVDYFFEEGLRIFGPTKQGAMIEGSKSYAKKLMRDRGIPTARYGEFTDRQTALAYLKGIDPPFVIKADGLAAGKGVSIAGSIEEAEATLYDLFERKVFGESGLRVVIEDYLPGEEATVMALCDGENIVPLLSSQDHKPVYDGDRGPNTGGMGAIAPAPVVTPEVMGRVIDKILLPLVDELRKRKIDYRGTIYAGLMIQDGNPSVVEFNCRFGDPEAEAVLPLLESDLFEAIFRAVEGDLKSYTMNWKKGYACDVVLASEGYPGNYTRGRLIEGLEILRGRDDILVFHAGTKEEIPGRIVTGGGRVLNIVGVKKTLEEAIAFTYEQIKHVHFEGMHYRRDIGFRGLKHLTEQRRSRM